jgi:hypothetical protein
MSITQKTLLFANIPTTICNYTIEKRMRDRFNMSPVTYPAITVSFMSEGIQKHWNTFAPIREVFNEVTKQYDRYYGGQDVANISLTVWSLDEDELREICHGLELQLRIAGLGFYWPRDHIKVTGIKAVQLLEPYADEFVQEHTWRAVIDFTVEYIWEILELDPSIKAFEYVFNDGPSFDSKTIGPISKYVLGSYGMDILMKGWRCEYDFDMDVKVACDGSCNFGMLVVS